MQRLSFSWDTLLVAAIVVVATVCAQAQAQEAAKEGKVVVLDENAAKDDLADWDNVQVVDEPVYWIGIAGRGIENEVLRTHLQLAADMGVVVEEVIPDSPAAKAGLRKHDILLRVNGDTVNNMQVLQSQVRAGKEKPLELKIVRLGKQENLVIVPELRPQKVQARGNRVDRFKRDLQADPLQQLMQQFNARNFGPGVVFQGGQLLDFNQMPNGVSVSVQRQNDGPPQVTVKKGDKTWQIEGDNPESLKQLPDDLRPFVERMLRRQTNLPGGLDARAFGFRDLDNFMPRGFGGFDRHIDPTDPTQKRIDDLERRMKDLMLRLEQQQPKVQVRR